MKRLLKLMAISLVSILCMTFASSILNGCADLPTTSTGPIPNGYYLYDSCYRDGAHYIYKYIFVGDYCNEDDYWEIEGDKALRTSGGWLNDKAKIKEIDSRIYFECYKWKDISNLIACYPVKQGTEKVYEVTFDATTKVLTLVEMINE